MTFLLKEDGFVLVDRFNFLPRVQSVRMEKWEQKRNWWKTGKVLCLESRSDSDQRVNEKIASSTCLLHKKKKEKMVCLDKFYLLFHYKNVWKKLSLLFSCVKRAEDWYTALCHWIWNWSQWSLQKQSWRQEWMNIIAINWWTMEEQNSYCCLDQIAEAWLTSALHSRLHLIHLPLLLLQQQNHFWSLEDISLQDITYLSETPPRLSWMDVR